MRTPRLQSLDASALTWPCPCASRCCSALPPLRWAGWCHDVFGLFLVAFLAFALGTSGFFAITGGVLLFTAALLAVYGVLTSLAVERLCLADA